MNATPVPAAGMAFVPMSWEEYERLDETRGEYIDGALVGTIVTAQRLTAEVPLLCVEVTSGNRTHDLVTKCAKYADAGLPEYWVVDRRDRVLRRYALHDGVLEDAGEESGAGERTVTVAGREVRLDLDRLFGEPVAG